MIGASIVTALLGVLWLPVTLVVLGSLGQILLGLPSVKEVLERDADLSGVSTATWLMVVLSGALWLVFDTGIGYPISGAAGSIQAVIALVVVFRVRRFRLSAPR